MGAKATAGRLVKALVNELAGGQWMGPRSVGVPDRLRGEIPVAYIVVRRPVDPADLEARCRTHMASFKVPRDFVTLEKLPRTALGKVQKRLLPPLDGSKGRA